jgi:transcriptional regulator with XRE-family HTH domain
MAASEIDRAVGRQIVVALAREGYSNVDLAEMLGTSESNVSRWLNGNVPISLDWLSRIARVLRLTVSDLLPTAEQESVTGYRQAFAALDSLAPRERQAVIDALVAVARAMHAPAQPAARGRIERVS